MSVCARINQTSAAHVVANVQIASQIELNHAVRGQPEILARLRGACALRASSMRSNADPRGSRCRNERRQSLRAGVARPRCVVERSEAVW